MTATGEVTAARIVEAGRQLVMRRGYSGFSYADIAEEIDIRKASIHHHFPAKTDLVIAVLRQQRSSFDADMAALQASGADGLVQVRAYIDYWGRCIADNSAPFCVAGMLAAELPALPAELAQEVRTYFDELSVWLEPALESAAKANLIKLGSPVQTEAAMLVSLIYGAMLASRAYANAALFKEVTDTAIERLVKTPKRTRSA
ncbi:TetR/AcrR family transcriptional regulator [Paraburkholderia sp. J12]|uniref:TetR/AcrR family transcriptional regulator n=1 Tax=Paraburkholderia sp. J12 TaxID=2805432 RepID=UPI002ABD60D7|nr:TetR/AcrR family transcriptional regulator [Paraburkholderia sp. J12]